MQDQPLSPGTLAPEIARGVCRKILSGPTFTAAPRLSRLLESCVEAYAAGSRPALDSGDRAELKRLRRKLDDYYAAEGASDPAIVELGLSDGSVRFPIRDAAADLPSWIAVSLPATPAAQQASSRNLKFAAAAVVLLAAAAAFLVSRRQASLDPASVHTLAVLPIDDTRPIQFHGTLVPGITASLTSELTHVSRWRTIAYASAAPFAFNLREMPAIRAAVGADVVVEGRLTPSDKTIDGELWMTRTSDGRRVWSYPFSASRDDLLPALDKAAQAVAAKLGASVPSYALLAPNSGKPGRDAVESFLTARATYQETPAEMQTALRALESAVAATPKFAAAQSALAEIWAHITELEYRPTSEAAPKAREIARAALALEPQSAEAHLALGVAAAIGDWDWATARKELEQAIALRPSYSYAIGRLGQVEETLGNTKAAVARFEQARLLNPSNQSINVALGFAYIFDGQTDKALQLMDSLEKLDPEYKVIRLVRAMAYFARKEYGRVASHVDNMSKMRAWMPPALGITAPAAALLGRTAEAQSALRELRNTDNFAHPDPVILAGILLALGQDQDKEAFDLLNKAVDSHSSLLLTLPVNPIFEKYRRDPRFQAVVAKLQAKR